MIFLYILLLTVVLSADENRWSTNGPYGARVATIAIHPFDNQHLLIGTIENGIYESTDGGAIWNWIETDSLYSNMRVLRIHPNGPDTMFAGTAQGFFKSIDGGLSWTRIYIEGYTYNEYRDILIHPDNPSILFTGKFGTGYKSTDGGATWTCLDLPPMASPEAFDVDRQNTDNIYLVIGSSDGRSVHKSEDLGDTWFCIHNDLDSTISLQDIAVDPIEPQTIYVSGLNRNDRVGQCIAKTTNGGINWHGITPLALLDNAYILSIALSPINHNTVYICSSEKGVFRSTDGGDNWEDINEGLEVRGIKTMTIDSLSGIIYLGTYYGGIYRSLDNGDHWEKISFNIKLTSCTDIAVNQRYPDSVYVTARNGFYRSVDGALSWEHVELCYPTCEKVTRSIQIDPIDPDYIYVGLYPYGGEGQGGIYRSTDGGRNWEFFNNGLPPDIYYDEIIAVMRNNENRRLFLTSNNGLYRSDDFGESWTLCEDGLPTCGYFNTIAASPANNNYIYLGEKRGYSDQRLYKSIDCGLTWEPISTIDGGIIAHYIACDSFDPYTAYITFDTLGILKTTDGGNRWIDINANLPLDVDYVSMSGIMINPYNPDNIFVCVQGKGIFISNNGGLHWDDFNEGMENSFSSGYPIFDPTDTSRIYLAGHSVWTITRTPTGIAVDDNILPLGISLSNYPNPFNARTTISYNLQLPTDVAIDIYDILGRQVETLVNIKQTAGWHKVVWNAESAASGIYFYKLTADGNSDIQKMMLLK